MDKKFQDYTYTGPLSSVTLRVDGEDVDVVLNARRPVSLPPGHPYTQTLLAQKLIKPIERAQATAPKPLVVTPAPASKEPSGKEK